MTSLYQLGEEFAELESAIADAQERGATVEEIDAMAGEWFDRLAGDLTVKAGQCVRYMRSQDAIADGAEAEAQRLTEYARARRRASNRVGELLRDVIVKAGSPKLQTDVGAVWVQRAGGVQPMQLDDIAIERVPPEWVRRDPVIDKSAIREALEAGEAIPFARLLPRRMTLRIK